MSLTPDTSIVDLHRVDGPLEVRDLLGQGHLIQSARGAAVPLTHGAAIDVGDTIALDAGSEARIGTLYLTGGRRGRAHAFVRADAFAASPGLDDVPRLLMELKRVESEISKLGKDPLESSELPSTPYARAVAEEFARLNLVPTDARMLSESEARRLRSVVLFVSEETAFIATSRVTVKKLLSLMTSIQRPVQPHLVDDAVIESLLARAYG